MTTKERLGSKRLVVGAHYGTFDFIVQRCTAVILVVYTLFLLCGILFSSGMSFATWQNLFTFRVGLFPLGQVLATLAFFAMLWHAWVGVRDIWMDYVRAAGLRLFLQTLTVLWLVGSLAYFAQIIWSL